MKKYLGDKGKFTEKVKKELLEKISVLAYKQGADAISNLKYISGKDEKGKYIAAVGQAVRFKRN